MKAYQELFTYNNTKYEREFLFFYLHPTLFIWHTRYKTFVHCFLNYVA